MNGVDKDRDNKAEPGSPLAGEVIQAGVVPGDGLPPDLPLLPAYADEALAEMSDDELIALMIGDEDRVPRNLIDEAARRETMIGALQRRLDLVTPVDATHGEWWLNLHAAMIWGLMPSLEAGEALIDLMQHLSDTEESDLDDWLAAAWPNLVINKPATMLERLQRIARQRSGELFLRINALRCVVAIQGHKGELEAALDWVAKLAGDGDEELEFRLLAAAQLLDFPRERHRRVLNRLAEMDEGEFRMFDRHGIDTAFDEGDEGEWMQPERAWDFYRPEAIRLRQERWASQENEQEDEYEVAPEPYVREAPKIGRNDPCPCGSGKKYKKCCLAADEAMQRNLHREDPF